MVKHCGDEEGEEKVDQLYEILSALNEKEFRNFSTEISVMRDNTFLEMVWDYVTKINCKNFELKID